MNPNLENNTQTNIGVNPNPPSQPSQPQTAPAQPVNPQPQAAAPTPQPVVQPEPPVQPVVQPQYVQVQKSTIPEEYKPISMWGYFGYEILFAIPLVGFILILVFSFGGARNINLRNFARSYFCVVIIAAIIIGLLFILGVGLFGMSGGKSMGYNY